MPKHRYTGEWPPLKVLEEIFNWDYALGEEHIKGQDETTLKPERNQKSTNVKVAIQCSIT